MQIPKLVVFDVDGTLIDWDGNVTRSTRDALNRLRTLDIPIALATGRPLAIASSTLAQVGGADWMVCGNGSALFEVATGWMLRDRALPTGVVDPIVHRLREQIPGIGVAIEAGSTVIEEHGFNGRVPEDPITTPVDDALAVLPEVDGLVRRVIFFHDDYDHRLDELAALVERLIDDRCQGCEPVEPSGADASACICLRSLQVQFGGLPIVDISPRGDHKAVALQVLVDHLDIDPADVIAFGDGGNDLEMLAWAGVGIAMGNARVEVQAAADHVTDHVNADGIAAFLGPLLG